ncbi:head scaffolding protein [Mycobacteroides phage 8UZL]|nr:head scaffolding protein [Mycobacteroides phage 8UZL]
MSGSNGGGKGPDAGAGNGGGGEGNGGGGEGFKPVTFSTQEEMNAAFADRAQRAAAQAKQEALKGLPEGVSLDDVLAGFNAYKQAEDAKKDEVTKEREAREAAERKLQAIEQAQQLRTKAGEIAKEFKVGDTPIPAELLRGGNEDELKAHAEAIKAFIEPLVGPRGPRHNPDQGNNGGGKEPAGDWLRDTFFGGAVSTG